MATLQQVIKAHPTIAALRQNYPAIADALNAPTVQANLDAGKVTQVPAPVTREDIIAAVAPADAWIIYSTAGGLKEDLFAAIDTDNHAWLTYLLSVAIASGKMSASTVTNLQALLVRATQSTAPATIAGPSIAAAAGLGVVSASDVQTADQQSGGAGAW